MSARALFLRGAAALAMAAGLVALGPVPARADETARRSAAQDLDLRESVANAVLRSVNYGVFDSVGVRVEDGVVTLVGSVYRPWHRRDIEQRVARVPGVRELHNQIRVQPASGFDDDLRRQLYARIYGRVLPQFAGSPDPPVRIVVERGHVTLTGFVNSRVEKVMLESAARGTMAFGVSNQVQVESEAGRESAG
jgi:hypothetical protein